MRAWAYGVLFSLAAANAACAQDSPCDKFAWPLTRERGWFAETGKPQMAAGEKLQGIPARAFIVTLQLKGGATFVMPPEKRPNAENWFGGAVSFAAVPRAGLYQVTLSDDAWVDLIQDGRYLRSAGSSGRRDCPGLRKSVRLELSAAPLILQLSGVESPSVAIAITAAD